MQSSIVWPKRFLPGTTDNFVSNEVIVSDLTAAKIWSLLADPNQWQSYYENCEKITASGPLKKGDHFSFSTFGFPVLPCVCEESEEPNRIAWSAEMEGVAVYHAWLVEDLGGRVRILTQESQIGKPAADLAKTKPNKMLLGHQDWLDGIVAAAKGDKVDKTNLNAAGY